jgi:ankyrin repeat protein
VKGLLATHPEWLDVQGIATGDTAVMSASHAGDYDKVQYLVNLGADIQIRNADGDTTLHLAAESGSVQIVEFLVKECEAVVRPLPLYPTP